ncbi:MAG: SEL1-like repeat protein, partial [Chlamydiota bacterium]
MAVQSSSIHNQCSVTQWPIQQVATTPCGHSFEAEPLLKWVGRHHVCPLDYQSTQVSELILPETFQRGVHPSSSSHLPTASSGIADEDFVFEWYGKAAQEGWVKAQVCLGECYTLGEGIPRDANAAAHWFKRAAIYGNKTAQYYFGSHLIDANDLKAAAYWFQKSAVQGSPYAQLRLSKCYRDGEGVAQSKNASLHWLEKAAIQGHAGAQRQLAFEGDFSSLRQAIFWLKKAADGGDAKAQYSMGNAYYSGNFGLEQSDSNAFDCYSLSAEQNYAPALFMVGWFMLGSHGVEEDPEGALVLIQAAADLGDPLAQQYLRGEFSNLENPESRSNAVASSSKGNPDDITASDVLKYVTRESIISLLNFTQDVSFSLEFKDFLPEPKDYLPEPWARWIPSPSLWAPSIRVEPIDTIRDRFLRKFNGNRELAAHKALKSYQNINQWDFQSVATTLAPAMLTSLLSGGPLTAFFMGELSHMWRDLRSISLVAAVYGHDTHSQEVQRRIFACFLNANALRLPFSATFFAADFFGVGYRSFLQYIASNVPSFVPDRFLARTLATQATYYLGGRLNPQEYICEYVLRRFRRSAQASAFART